MFKVPLVMLEFTFYLVGQCNLIATLVYRGFFQRLWTVYCRSLTASFDFNILHKESVILQSNLRIFRSKC